jgi:hypothetical protein
MAPDSRRNAVRIFVYSLIGLLVLLFGYLAVTGVSAYRALASARSDLGAAQDMLGTAPAESQQALQSAQASAESAATTLTNPVWSAVSSVPYFGATPKAAGIVARSLDQALVALQPALSSLDVLKPASLVQNGQIDISAVEQAVPSAEQALPGIENAQATLALAPDSGLLMGQVRDARTQLGQQLASLESTLNTAITFGKVAGPLLGQDGQKRYFLGLLNPNEARGTGGFLGTYAILTATQGAITIDQIGSNTDVPSLTELPVGIGEEFRARYGDDPILVGNMNMSPNFPDTAKIWLSAWEQKTGEELDGAMALDVVSLGQLISASGQPVTLPNGTQLSGAQLTRFALRDIYEQFPDAAVRKEYQEAVAQSALNTVTALSKPLPMAQVLGQALTDRRIVIWSRDKAVEQDLQDAGVSGTLTVPDGHYVMPVVINSTGSKLDAWLNRGATYDVGRCVTDGRVTSSVTVDLRSDVPLGERPPAYMIGSAQEGPNGPIHIVTLQVHLPNGAEVTGTTLNGEDTGSFTFTEQGRPAAAIGVELPPRVTQRVTFTFTEPASDGSGIVQEQPLATAQAATVRDVGCS